MPSIINRVNDLLFDYKLCELSGYWPISLPPSGWTVYQYLSRGKADCSQLLWTATEETLKRGCLFFRLSVLSILLPGDPLARILAFHDFADQIGLFVHGI